MGKITSLVVILFTILFFITTSGVEAQSCGSSYVYPGGYEHATCPSNKSCSNFSCPKTFTDASCQLFGPICYSTRPYQECSFGTCDANGNHSCTIQNWSHAFSIESYCTACPYNSWQNYSSCGDTTCGGQSCAATEMCQRRSPSNYTSVCQSQYRCAAISACSPDPKAPSNPAGSCNASNGINLSWTGDTNATHYALRVDDTTTGGWDGTCSGGGDFCANVGPASYSFTGTLNHSYNWWVHACNGNTGICSASTGGPAFSCLGTPPTPTYTPTPTFTPSPTPTTAPPAAYFKVKNASFYKLGSLSSPIPLTATGYDSSDIAPFTVFNQGTSGIVAAHQGTISVAPGGTVSSSGLKLENQSIPSTFNAASFKSYVVTKKSATTINNLASITGPGIYYYDNGGADLTISSDIAYDKVVLVVNGNVIINGSGAPVKFNAANRPFALVVSGTTGSPKTLTFANTLTEAHGVFVTDAVSFGSGATPLKIVGNISSSTAASMGRDRGTTAPSLFIVFDQTQYVGLFDRLSVVKSSWTQIQ